MRHDMQWTVGHSDGPDTLPARMVPAAVPGAVQLDWARAEGWPDHTYADNHKAYAWMEDKYWTYSTNLQYRSLAEGERLYLVGKGIDYAFDIVINGTTVFSQEGMFTPVDLDITDVAAPGAELRVIVHPTPKREGADGRAQADQSCKPAVSYGWDWHPRLIPLGIWDDAFLEIRGECHIHETNIDYTLTDAFDRADIRVSATLSTPMDGTVKWTLRDADGKTVCEASAPASSGSAAMACTLDAPGLWWPNNEGDQVLYTGTFELIGPDGLIDTKTARVGFRRVRLAMFPGAWNEPKGYPLSRSHPPITMEINGRRIFCKGTNWVNPEIFPGIITRDTYRILLDLAKDANFNMLRIWGGGIVNKESFFELCDEMGLMVWQEFPLACNNYVGTPGYLKVLDQESRSIIKRLKAHPCVTLWCGGNELFNGWSGMTDQSLALRLLNSNCYTLDPETPFLMTSPLDGMAHGHYSFRYGPDEDVFQAMPKARNTAYTEFGCPGPSPADYIRKFIPQDEIFPPRPGTAWEEHHAFKAWMPEAWLFPSTIEGYFGPSSTLEELVAKGQILQSAGYKCIYEEARRQKPRCAMALNWCWNEPWPSAANNSLVNYPAEPKPAYYAVKDSCRPVLASARIPRFDWNEGDAFTPELWVLNDSPKPVPAGTVKAYLRFGNEELFMLRWDVPALEPNTNLQGPSVRFVLPHRDAVTMELVLRMEGVEGADSTYTLAYTKRQGPRGHQPRLMNT